MALKNGNSGKAATTGFRSVANDFGVSLNNIKSFQIHYLNYLKSLSTFRFTLTSLLFPLDRSLKGSFVRFPGSNGEAKTFLARNGKVIIRMRGLPFDSGDKDVVSGRQSVGFCTSVTRSRHRLFVSILRAAFERLAEIREPRVRKHF